MNDWHQVRIERHDDDRVVVIDTLESPTAAAEWPEPAPRSRPAAVPELPHGATQVAAPRPVLPRPAPVLCATCVGVGSVEVVTGASWLTTTASDRTTPDARAGAQRSWTSRRTCDRCRGLGWVLVAAQVGPVSPSTPMLPLPPPYPWRQPLGPQVIY